MKTQISRRGVIAGLLTGVATTVITSASTTSPVCRHKVQWAKLTCEPVGIGDMWASTDPNQPEKQGDDYNLQMQAAHNTTYGIPADKIGRGNGDFWRPIGLVPC